MTVKRILISTHAPLDPIFGAAQMALNLGAALRNQGHDVTFWSPHPIPEQIRPRLHHLWMRHRFREFIAAQDPFDIVDIVPLLWNRELARDRRTIVVSRHVQPELAYRFLPAGSELPRPDERRLQALLAHGISGLQNLEESLSILNGWRNASVILCLGSLDLMWMQKTFPVWSRKTFSYLNALSPEEQPLLATVRRERNRFPGGAAKFLWIGRWSAHKGIRKLRDFILKRLELNSQDSFTIAGCGESAASDFPPETVGKRIFLLPRVDRAEIVGLLKSHDVGLFTSVVEGWGLSLNEMVESGMPVYATEAGGVPDLRKVIASSIFPFPPPDVLPPFSPPEDNAFRDYYNTFSWDSAATSLLHAVSAVSGGQR